MTAIKFFRPPNRLAEALQKAGGFSAEQAVRNAHNELEKLRSECMDSIDDKIARIDLLIAKLTAGEVTDENGEDNRGVVYEISNQILNEAGLFGLSELSTAARGLCALASLRETLSDTRALRVHIDAMKSLRHPDVQDNLAVRMAVLEGLQELAAKLALKNNAGSGA